MSRGNIRLHREHGLNPTIPVCTWCGQPKNEIALLGAAYKGKAPMQMAVDRNSCDKCQEAMSLGITLVEATIGPDGRPVTAGCWTVMKEESFKRIFEGTGVLEPGLEKRMCMVDSAAWDHLGLPREDIDNRPEIISG